MQPVLRVCSLYPDLMNIYADRGNLIVLERRCSWRGIAFELTELGLGQQLHPDAHELIYLGGGQDQDQLTCAEDLLAVKGQALRQAAEAGVLILGVCGGYQLLGHSYEISAERRIEGLGLLDAWTVRGSGQRLIGNIAIELELDAAREGAPQPHASPQPHAGPQAHTSAEAHATPQPRVLAGFENHGGRTHLGSGQAPLGRVLRGHGNDGRSGFEGARTRNVIGTYLHGPLLPKNAWFADWLIATALGVRPDQLPPLDDALEQQAHLCARRAAGV